MTAEIPASRRKQPPTHPGELIREILGEHCRLSISDAARRLRITRQSLHAVISGRAAVTPEMALRLGRLFGKPPELWLRMQQAYDSGRPSRASPTTSRRSRRDGRCKNDTGEPGPASPQPGGQGMLNTDSEVCQSWTPRSVDPR
jgi:antitoxin HigA-1